MATTSVRPSFGIKTSPSQVGYAEILRVWEEADSIPEIEHAWLFDHLLPIYGDPLGSAHEGWTLLAALAARTDRVRLGHIVTSNRFRPPAVLAKMAAEVDIVSGGRLVLGIGAGSAPVPGARREYDAHGLPYIESGAAVASLAESCTILRRLWTEDAPFDFSGEHHELSGAFCSPKPVQSHLPILIGGGSPRTLRVVARHADVWNMPGPPAFELAEVVRRSGRLDAECDAVGRDPATIARLAQVGLSLDDPEPALAQARALIDAGFTQIVFSLAAPYPPDAAWMVAERVIAELTG